MNFWIQPKNINQRSSKHLRNAGIQNYPLKVITGVLIVKTGMVSHVPVKIIPMQK